MYCKDNNFRPLFDSSLENCTARIAFLYR